MTTQDLANNRERIIKNIKWQITLATKENISGVMTKMVNMLPQFSDEKPLMKNIDKLTFKAIESYIKHDIQFTRLQKDTIETNMETKRKESFPSNLQN
ncbi:hypothetical protein [Chryseobacterium gallinarum]|uniref:Uncharacterized protein n=1 Tax=Chryseobacterium gallinarum TaxID=1324352 RepID=A0ABX6KUF2_CHRGL|nr:hypothetical protein [Chryseobacterium gallinarum]QIY92227.1 hypothetical protein FOB44_16845 [Chryseobacterium gallinarum]